jgi:hypothetical protein
MDGGEQVLQYCSKCLLGGAGVTAASGLERAAVLVVEVGSAGGRRP